MVKNLFINLPIKNLKNTVAFFTALGFEFNPTFTDESSTCMIVNESIFVMLLEESKFKTFTTKDICDTKHNTEIILSLQVETRAEVDVFIQKVLVAGGNIHMPPQDLGFMCSQSFLDVDGHSWEVFFMEEQK